MALHPLKCPLEGALHPYESTVAFRLLMVSKLRYALAEQLKMSGIITAGWPD